MPFVDSGQLPNNHRPIPQPAFKVWRKALVDSPGRDNALFKLRFVLFFAAHYLVYRLSLLRANVFRRLIKCYSTQRFVFVHVSIIIWKNMQDFAMERVRMFSMGRDIGGMAKIFYNLLLQLAIRNIALPPIYVRIGVWTPNPLCVCHLGLVGWVPKRSCVNEGEIFDTCHLMKLNDKSGFFVHFSPWPVKWIWHTYLAPVLPVCQPTLCNRYLLASSRYHHLTDRIRLLWFVKGLWFIALKN